ncbi:MAG TPA: hypothetical protein VNJ54_03110 [Plantibacter sp.]|uniref:hypothetical protein n=1 Tax=unclassified Plantibacter TaxID=2624265 RepID=UPI002CE2C1DD|nr:hypothetical protein [Plantibacter sp.]
MSDQPEQPSGQFQPLQPGGTPEQADVRYGAAAPKRKRNPVVIWLSVLAGVLAVALVVVIGLLAVGPMGAPVADSTSTPSSSSTVSPTTAPTDVAETPAAPARPTECTQLFPAGYIESLTADGFLELNPAWAQPTLNESFGSNDDALVALLTPTDRLTCDLSKASGAGEVFILTNVAWVEADTQAAAITRMNDAGFTCSEELGGTMCFTENDDPSGNTTGERHFLRDGTWVATRWANVTITGWTQTIVQTLFPA